MDPMFMNIGLQHHVNPLSSSVIPASAALNQLNGIPQESKLATYISNRQQSHPQPILAPSANHGNSSQSSHVGIQSQSQPSTAVLQSHSQPSQVALQSRSQPTQVVGLQSLSQSSQIGLQSHSQPTPAVGLQAHSQPSQVVGLQSHSQPIQTGLQTQQQAISHHSLTKTLTALGIDSLKKPVISNLNDSNISNASNLSHSASTPSFQSFGQISSSPNAFSTLSDNSSTNSPLIEQSPPSITSPIRGISASPSSQQKSSAATADSGQQEATYHENVGGTTYFYTAQDMNNFGPGGAPSSNSQEAGASSQADFQPYSIVSSMAAHIHHMKIPTNSSFFMGDELRREMLEKQALMHSYTNNEKSSLPETLEQFHRLAHLEPPNNTRTSSIFGYTTSVFKAANQKTGVHYCLYRVHGYRLNNTKVTQIVDLWKKLQHSNLINFREVFTTKAFGDHSIVFVYDYYPGSETLSSRHFSQSSGAHSNGSWEKLTSSLTAETSSLSRYNNSSDTHQRNNKGMLSEATLWNYIIQLTGALRCIHMAGLACRTVEASKILLTDNRTRIRFNCLGIVDVLNFDPNSSNPLAGIQGHQQEDLVNLGKLIVSLSCNSPLALQRDNISTAIDLINSQYSRDLSTLVVCLLTSQRIKNVNDVMPVIGARFYAALETATQKADVYEAELFKELQNGRLFRLITKLNSIVDRQQLNMDPDWSETGDRYMLKLFRDYAFHQNVNGQPWMDLGHITSVLNKLDSGSSDKICLMSHNEQNVLVVSYDELKRCFERSFKELLQVAVLSKDGQTSAS